MLAAVACAIGAVGTASAHVQVSPTVAAPGDPILVTLLVPNERPESTTKVTVQVPEGVIPFSFGTTPGWKRKEVTAPNGSISELEWTGKLDSDGFVAFQLLASTPDTPGTIEWKALQQYSDGQVVSWIGDAESENPSPVMRIDANAPRQNAGGEGAAGTEPASAGGGGNGGARGGSSAAASLSSSDADWLARLLALAAIAIGFAAIILVVRRRPVQDASQVS